MAGKTNIHKKSPDTGDSTDRYELKRLVEACIARNRAAQKELYDKYAPKMYGLVLRYVSDHDTANGILNEIFYRVLTKLEQYNFQGAFEGWIRRIAMNIITDSYRKNAKHTGLAEMATGVNEVYVDNDVIGKIAYKELLQMIHQLPDTQRMVFNMFVFESCSHKEISEQLNLTEGNSRWHLNDARRRLKEKIKEIMR